MTTEDKATDERPVLTSERVPQNEYSRSRHPTEVKYAHGAIGGSTSRTD